MKTNRMIYNTSVIDNDPPCVRTAKVLQKIANNIYKEIQVTYDTPALHQDGRLPVLDLAVWVYDNQIYHSFFKKEVSSKFTVM